MVIVGSIFFFGFLGVPASSSRSLGSILEGSGLHFASFWCPCFSHVQFFVHDSVRSVSGAVGASPGGSVGSSVGGSEILGRRHWP